MNHGESLMFVHLNQILLVDGQLILVIDRMNMHAIISAPRAP